MAFAYRVEILQDASAAAEPSTLDTLELRRIVNKELYNTKLVSFYLKKKFFFDYSVVFRH